MIPIFCLLVVLLIPYVLAGVGARERKRVFGETDNRGVACCLAQFTLAIRAA